MAAEKPPSTPRDVAPSPGTVLVVDDDPAVGKVLTALLGQDGIRVLQASSGSEALEKLGRLPVDVVVSDVRMPGMDGLELLRNVSQSWPDVPVILLTAHGTVPLAVEAMKAGAADFVLKPFDRDELLFIVRKALTRVQRTDATPPGATPLRSDFVGASPPMSEALALLKKAAAGNATVLLRGESGTGKELAARAVHDNSPRRAGPFVTLHCAALPDTLLESELFGYEKGAFTGASARKPGRVELAAGGTLFLDEIGDITPATQVKLLRLLQERAFERLGGTQTQKADVRFVAATHRNLEEMVARGEFREDLFYRLNVVPITLPALRERPEDIAPLVRHFVQLLAAPNGRPGLTIDDEAVELLVGQPWPGNVRQLQNFVERLVVLTSGERIAVTEVEKELSRQTGALSTRTAATAGEADATLEQQRRQAERQALEDALAKARNNRTLAARLLGVSRRTLYNKLEEHGLV